MPYVQAVQVLVRRGRRGAANGARGAAARARARQAGGLRRALLCSLPRLPAGACRTPTWTLLYVCATSGASAQALVLGPGVALLDRRQPGVWRECSGAGCEPRV